jgi:hypothetical protein
VKGGGGGGGGVESDGGWFDSGGLGVSFIGNWWKRKVFDLVRHNGERQAAPPSRDSGGTVTRRPVRRSVSKEK